MSLIAAVLIGFAGWRLAAMVVFEAGPYRIFERLRNFAAPPGPVEGQLGILLTCIYCCSVWTTGGMGAVWFLAPYGNEIVTVIAAMTFALLVEQAISRKTLTD